jgi:arylsulfatase A-like enzyme
MGRQSGNNKPGWAPNGVPPLPLIRDSKVVEEQPDQGSLTGRYLEDACEFLRRHGDGGIDKEKPFFLYFAHMYVHLPIYVPESFLRNSRNGRYGAAVACIDWVWSVLDDELKRLGLAGDTLVMFTSDNGSRASEDGPNSGSGSNAPLRGGKFTTWEGGFRLPCIMRWPGKIKAGTVCDEIVSSIDFLPTIAKLADAAPSSGNRIDGLDFSGLLLGKANLSPRKDFAYFSNGNLCALRHGRWKLHFCRKPEKWNEPFAGVRELYDVVSDAGETRNVFEDNPDAVAEINRLAVQLRERLGDAFSGVSGREIRPCGKVQNPKPLTTFDDSHPYVVAEYDLSERG